MKTLFITIAYRNTKSEHSYVVGVFSNLSFAQLTADEECGNRGGGYDCQVYEIETNKRIEYSKSEAKYEVKGRN